MEQLLAHAFGDYVLQSRWMAQNKTHQWMPAIVHGLLYTLPFLLLTTAPGALLAIGVSHTIIDRFRLAKHISWLRDRLAPSKHRVPWNEYATPHFGGKPEYLYFWLLIIVDNTIHLTINYVVLLHWR